MIAQLRGRVIEQMLDKDALRVVVDVHGVGYEMLLTKASENRLSSAQDKTFYISESVTAFDGATTLYGFVSREEKDIFMRIRENVDGMGPKKALECIDKISKSLPDFKRAVIDADVSMLVSIFGFTKKTAEKLVFSLKEKVAAWPVAGPVRWADAMKAPEESEALSGLLNLGYRDDEARDFLSRAKTQLGVGARTEQLLQEALRLAGSKT
jgi:holliday junction DNA helicase RuvA